MVAVAAIIGATASTTYLWADRQSTRQRAEATAGHLVRLLAGQVAHGVDVATLIASSLPDSGELSASRRDRLRAALATMPPLDTVVIVDARGRVVVDLAGRLEPGAVISDRDWVRSTLTDVKAGARLAPAAANPVGGGAALVVASPLMDPVHGLAGAVGAAIPLSRFGAIADDVGSGGGAAFGLFRRSDATQLLRMPIDGIDMTGDAPPGLSERSADSEAGTYWTTGRAGPLLVSYRVVAGKGLVAWVCLDGAVPMAAWTVRAGMIGACGGGAVLVLAALGAMLARTLRTERKAAAALRAANQELSRSNADLEQFAYVASHDLKEPLRNIASYVQLLQRRYQGRLDEDADAFIGYTVDGVRRMQAIINELLVYSRIGTGPLSRDLVQSGVLVAAALANLKTVIAEAGAAIEVTRPLPVVLGDAGQLASVFQNLIANALKYRRDDVRPEVAIAAVAIGDQWEFRVSDNGIGIDPQYHAQIFELFKRLHARDRYSGSGIGLAVCQRVIERHGGRIWVESAPGRGATFHFTLPKV